MRMTFIYLIALILLLPLSALAEIQSATPSPLEGEGSDDYYDPPIVGALGWPVDATGSTCGHSRYYSTGVCQGFGSKEDAIYGFYSPLGRGTGSAISFGGSGYKPMLFSPVPGLGFDSSPCPTSHSYSGYTLEFPVRGPHLLNLMIVDGNFYEDVSCGPYEVIIHYTPEQLGWDGAQGAGGTGGPGGPGGTGGVACTQQVGNEGYPGVAGQPGGTGGMGGSALLTIASGGRLELKSRFYLGGPDGSAGPQGATGSTGGAGGSGGGVFTSGGVGGEPTPDFDPSSTNGGAGGTWAAGTGGAGVRGGGGGGGGGSAPFVGGGDGGPGGDGARGATGSGSNGSNGSSVSQTISDYFIINDPFIVGGSGGRGGQGGQGGCGGGGGGGAGECWGNTQGAGGPGGPGGAGGAGGPGGPGGSGTLVVADGATLRNMSYLEVGRGLDGGAGSLILQGGASLSQSFGDTIRVGANGEFRIESDAQFQNYGAILNETPVLNQGILVGRGTMSGTLENEGMVQLNSSSYPPVMGTFVHRGVLEVPTGGDVVPFGPYLSCDTAILEAGCQLHLLLDGEFDEEGMVFGVGFKVLEYADTPGSLQGTFDTVVCDPPLQDGAWWFDYDVPLGNGRRAVYAVYDQDLSPVPEEALPRAFALTEIFPNPFNPRAVIRYELPRSAAVAFTAYDVRGRLVWQWAGTREAGRHELVFEGVDRQDRALASGTYLLRMEAGDFRATRRLTLIR